MNKNHLIQTCKQIRFRRWSRKNYAIFAGLHKIISIGQLAVNICEMALKKAHLTFLESVISVSDFAINEKGTEEKELVIQELLLQQNNFTTINTEAFNAQSLKYLIYG